MTGQKAGRRRSTNDREDASRNYVRDVPITRRESEYMLREIRNEAVDRHLAREIHLSEDTICFETIDKFCTYLDKHDQHARAFLRKVAIDDPIRLKDTRSWLPELAGYLSDCDDLEEVEIGVDEPSLVRLRARQRYGAHAFNLLRPQDIDAQLNIVILPEVQALRELRIPKFTFTDLHRDVQLMFEETMPHV